MLEQIGKIIIQHNSKNAVLRSRNLPTICKTMLLNNIARYISHKTGMDMRMSTAFARNQLLPFRGLMIR